MRSQGAEQQHKAFHVLEVALRAAAGFVDVDHQLADGGVVAQRLDVLAKLLDGLMQQAFGLGGGSLLADLGGQGAALRVDDHLPGLVQEAIHAFDAVSVPGLHLGERPHEHLVEPECVRPVAFDDFVGVDHVFQ